MSRNVNLPSFLDPENAGRVVRKMRENMEQDQRRVLAIGPQLPESTRVAVQVLDGRVQRLEALMEAMVVQMSAERYGINQPYAVALARDQAGTSFTAAGLELPAMKRCRLFVESNVTGTVTLLKKGTATVDWAAGLSILALDPTAGSEEAGFPLGAITEGTKLYLTITTDHATDLGNRNSYVRAWIQAETDPE